MNFNELNLYIDNQIDQEDNDKSRDHLFIEKVEEILYFQTPEQKTELFNINCDGVDIDGFLISDEVIRFTYVDYNKVAQAEPFDVEKFDEDLQKISKIKKQYSELEELIAEFDTEDPIFDVYNQFLEKPRTKIEIQLLTNKTIGRMGEMMLKGMEIDYGIKVVFYDSKKITEYLGKHNNEVLDVISFKGQKIEYVRVQQEQNDVYFFILPTITLAKLYDEFETRLLQDNVRLFLKTSGVNKGIKKTLERSPELFLSYNNGLSAVCKDIKFDANNNIESVKGLQIVNGGQTTASLHDAYKSNVNLEDSYVQVKLSHVKNTDNYVEMVTNIARYANTQNKVNNSDFISAHTFFIGFEKIASKEIIPCIDRNDLEHQIFFERMRGQAKIELGKVTKKTFEEKYLFTLDIKQIAQIENIWYGHPREASKGGEKSLQFFLDQVENIELSVETFRDIVARQLIVKHVEELMEYSEAPGNRYQTTSRSKKFGPIASSIKYYSLYRIFNKLNAVNSDLSVIYFAKSAKDFFEENYIMNVIDTTFKFFDKMQTEVNMIARNEETQNNFKEMFKLR